MKTAFKKFTLWLTDHPNKKAALYFALLAGIFILPGFLPNKFFAPIDIKNFVAPYLDITTQILPWYQLSKQLLLSGHMPFWNIFSGQGLPLLANMQTAVFFPLTWVFYLLPVKFALLSYSFLKLWLMGMLTFWYLRELRLGFYPAFFGGVLFAFCGANSIWLLWPLTNVILVLPLSLLLIEKYFNSKKKAYALALSPVIAGGIFAGHPQTFFYIFLAIAAYTVFKILDAKSSWKNKILICLGFAGIYLLGLAISAVALLPFLEYLKLSANLDYRAGFTENPFYLPKLLFLANLIPDFYGNTGVKNFSYLLVPNYGEMSLGYIGLSGLLMGLFAFGKKTVKAIWFFGAAALAVLMLIYHAPFIYQLVNKLPGFSLNYNNRLLYLFAFFVSVLAAFGLEKLQKLEFNQKVINKYFAGFTLFAGLLILINKLSTRSWNFAHNLDWPTVSLWQNVLILVFALNLVLCYLIIKRLPKMLTALLVLVVIETVIHGMIFTKTSGPDKFYPQTPALTFLQKKTSSEAARVFTYGHNLLPNIGTWYHINQLNDHDTMYLRSNKLLKQKVATFNYSPEYTFDEPNLSQLSFLNVKYLLYPAKEGEAFFAKHKDQLSLEYQDADFRILSLKKSLPRAYAVEAKNLEELDSKLLMLSNYPEAVPIYPATNFAISLDGIENISISAPNDTYLITADNYYPDWNAKINGQSIKTENALGFRALPLPAGKSQVQISYHPDSFYLGLKITLAALTAWLIAFIVALVNKRNDTFI